MKKRLLSFFAIFAFATSLFAQVDVIYFYGKQRCPTCRAIETETASLVETEFKKEIQSKEINFKRVDISLDSNAALVDKYKVSWSSLLIVSGDKFTNLTKEAFATARRNPELFRKILQDKISEFLKK